MQTTRKRVSSRILLGRSLVVIAMSCVFASIAIWVYSTFYPDKEATMLKTHVALVIPLKPIPGEDHEASAQAQKYMHALLTRDYATMWTMLHPQVQAIWPNEQAFVTFWHNRFQDYTLQSFTLRTPSDLNYWVNPETMVQYSRVVQVPVSLDLAPTQTPSQQMPPEDAHPGQLYQNLPIIVQYTADQRGKGGHWFVLAGGPADLEAPILPPLKPVNRTVLVPILMYHHIAEPRTQSALDRSLAVLPQMFGKQLDYLKVRNYHSITFNQLFNALYYQGPLPKKPIILTFDDGYDDAYTFAYPLLKQHGFSGMFYIITGKIGWKGQMTWSQMREMLRNGMQMGSHTVTHADMGAAILSSKAWAQQQLQASQSILQKNLGIPIQQFCYPAGEPFGHYSVIVQQEVLTLLVADGYVGATTDPGGKQPAGIEQSSLQPLDLLRLRVDGRASLQFFMATLP